MCSERAEILDPLIRFMYRDETQLNLHAMHRQDFFLFADAAEKYDVWSLKQLLRTFMTWYVFIPAVHRNDKLDSTRLLCFRSTVSTWINVL